MTSRKPIVWRTTSDTYLLYLGYAAIICESEPNSDTYENALSQIYRLPNFPSQFAPFTDVFVQPELIKAPTVQVH